MSILITPTLLNSFDFYTNVQAAEWKEKAFKDLLGTLRRDKPWDPTPAIKMGIKFEDTVYKQCEEVKKGAAYTGSELLQSVVARCVGGEFQRKSKYNTVIDGLEFCVYNKMDVVFPRGTPDMTEGYIIDIKTTGDFSPKYGPRKYLKGWQHKTYCVSEQIPHFEYLVVEWKGKELFKMHDVHSVTAYHKDLDGVKREIDAHIMKFVQWTRDNEDTFGTYTALTTIFSRF